MEIFGRDWAVSCIAASMALTAVPAPGWSQSGVAGPRVAREETIIGGRPATTPFERCVDVQIGAENAFDCLNQKLRGDVERVKPSLNLPPIDSRSADHRVGNVNEAAIRQQYGSNYGRSAIPFRPPSPALVLPRR